MMNNNDTRDGESSNNEIHENSSSNLSGLLLSNISDALVSLSEMTKAILDSFRPIFAAMEGIRNVFANTIPKEYFRGLAEFIQELYNNPDSLINYRNYNKKLDNFHWAWPYNFTASELKSLIETVEDEKGFDTYMIKHFSSGRDSRLIDSILIKLPKRHRAIFKQIAKAYNRGDYAIANNTLVSIIDNLLAEYLANPGQVRRTGLFHPIVDLWFAMSYNTDIAFRLMILAHNIDFVFEDYNFAKKIDIKTNKKIRRHPTVHGFKYSNQKVDSLMLMNTLWELLSLKDVLHPYRHSLVISRATKSFRFLYKGIIINHNKKPSQPTLKRRFFKKKAAFFSWPGLGKEWC